MFVALRKGLLLTSQSNGLAVGAFGAAVWCFGLVFEAFTFLDGMADLRFLAVFLAWAIHVVALKGSFQTLAFLPSDYLLPGAYLFLARLGFGPLDTLFGVIVHNQAVSVVDILVMDDSPLVTSLLYAVFGQSLHAVTNLATLLMQGVGETLAPLVSTLFLSAPLRTFAVSASTPHDVLGTFCDSFALRQLILGI